MREGSQEVRDVENTACGSLGTCLKDVSHEVVGLGAKDSLNKRPDKCNDRVLRNQ